MSEPLDGCMEGQTLHVYIGAQNICRGSLVWLGGPQGSGFLAVISLHDFLGVHLVSFSRPKRSSLFSVMTISSSYMEERTHHIQS